MHTHLFDRYQTQNSFLHRLSPIVKVVVAVLLILSNALLPDGNWLGFWVSWVLVLGLNFLARLGWDFTLKRSLIALPFALTAITAFFSLPGKTLAIWHLGGLELILTNAGLIRFLSIIIRSWLSVQVAVLLVATTQFPDLIHALEHLRLPKMLVTVIAFLYRYIFVLSDEMIRLLRARQARSAVLPGQHGGGSVFWRARVAGNMVGQLFLRSYERSDRIYNAMLSRGYRGHIRTLNRHEMKACDWLFIIFALLFIVSLQVFIRLN